LGFAVSETSFKSAELLGAHVGEKVIENILSKGVASPHYRRVSTRSLVNAQDKREMSTVPSSTLASILIGGKLNIKGHTKDGGV